MTEREIIARFLDNRIDRKVQIASRVARSVEVDPTTACWNWTGPDSGDGRGGGYPRMSLDGQTVAVHRVIAAMVFGPLNRRRQVDHKCRNRCCVNPDHLEVVTHKENQRRRDAAKGDHS